MITTQHGQQPDEQLMLAYQAGQQKAFDEFVTTALEKALNEKLKAAYISANKDLERKKTINDWAQLEIER